MRAARPFCAELCRLSFFCVGLVTNQTEAANQPHGSCKPIDPEEATARVASRLSDSGGIWVSFQPASECGAAILKTARVVLYHVPEQHHQSGMTQPWTLASLEVERLELVLWLSIDDKSSDIYAYYKVVSPVALQGTLSIGVVPTDVKSIGPEETIFFQAVNFGLSRTTYNIAE